MNDVRAIMTKVLVALAPAAAVHVWLFGPGLLVNCAVGVATALVCEAVMLRARGKTLAPALYDVSAPVTAVLLAFALPPVVPWWLVVVGVAFAIVVAKQLYGGIGFNPFNPAMAGYVVLLISFPVEMTQWPTPFDGVTAATPLDRLGAAALAGDGVQAVTVMGTGWEWLSLAVAVGGLWLLTQRVIRWPIPVTFLGTLTLLATVFWLIDPSRFASPAFHLVGGATMLCAFFIATDPVTAATTPRGRVVYGIGIGVLVWVLRSFGNYPDGVAFAVLLMNMAAPALDHFTRPRHADAR